jgi:hypothetical protein
MKLPKNAIIEAAASVDPSRYVICDPYLSIEHKSVIATDGRCMAIVPVELEDGDVSGWLSEDALKAARKQASKLDGLAVLHCNGSLALNNGASFPRPNIPKEGESPMTYPNWKAVTVPKGKNKHILAIDVDLLVNLAKAMGTSKLRLEMAFEQCKPSDPSPESFVCNDSIRVTPCQSSKKDSPVEGSYGVLMPMRVS